MLLYTLCYVEKDGQYLMLHRTKKKNDVHKGLWVGLGGKIEPGESPEDCVIREVLEESGLKISKPRLHGIMTFPRFANYVFLFTATNFTGSIKNCAEGELAWVDKHKLHELPMHKGDYDFIKRMQEYDGVFSAKYVYRDGALADITIAEY